MKPLRTFRLEEYLGEWEFKARHHLTASDAESMTIEELLALGTDAEREGFAKLPLSYIETWGTPDLREAVAGTYERVDADHVLAFAGAEEALYWAMLELVGPGEHAVITVPCYQAMETVTLSTGADVSPLVTAPGERLGARPGRASRAAAAHHEARRRQLPQQPDRLRPGRGDVPRARGALRRARHPAVLRRGLPRHRGRLQRGRITQAADLSETAISLNVAVQVLRAARPARRLAGVPRPRPAGAPGEAQALHDDLQSRPRRSTSRRSRCGTASRSGTRNRGIVAANRPLFDDFFGRWADLFDWEPPVGGCVCFPRYKGGDVEDFCRQLLDAEGVLVLPASMYYSEIAEVPSGPFPCRDRQDGP